MRTDERGARLQAPAWTPAGRGPTPNAHLKVTGRAGNQASLGPGRVAWGVPSRLFLGSPLSVASGLASGSGLKLGRELRLAERSAGSGGAAGGPELVASGLAPGSGPKPSWEYR